MGPLQGLRIIEMAGIGPGPFVGMLLADMGAEVIVIDRKGKTAVLDLAVDVNRRGKKSIIVDIKSEAGKKVFFKLCETADALFEGYRPGVMEKLGLGPEQCFERNPALIYGRMTGWGQTGPLSQAAGHDANYLAITGALHAMGAADQPPPIPLNLVGDYGGGMFLAFGLICGILNARQSGKGQVVDAAMIDGVNSMMSLFHSCLASGMWQRKRGGNFLDGSAPYYRNYETSDGKYVSLGAIEYPFMQVFVEKSGAPKEVLDGHKSPANWPKVVKILEDFFKTRTQQQWCELLEGSDACFAPIIPFWEAPEHAHNKERNGFVEIDGVIQPAPAPRFSSTAPRVESGPVKPGADTVDILQALGFDAEAIASFDA